jgi:hypothetical protein
VATLYGGGTAITNPMSLSPAPVTYYQLGDQSVSTGPTSDYLVPNNSLQDYVFDFDSANNEYIDCGNDSSLQITGAMTVSYWFKGQGGSGTVGGFGKLGGGSNRGFCLGMVSSGDITFYIAPTASTLFSVSYTRAVDTNWHHLVGVYNPSTSVKIYLDGNLVSETLSGVPASQYNGSNNLQIGARGDNSGVFNGEISNAAIWNSGLTPTQVTTLYNNGSPAADISSLSPVGWWKLNAADTFDGTDWTITDYAGSNDGTSFNMDSANLVQSNLQHTSGYSPYALDFDGVDDYLDFNNASANIMANKNAISISGWFKLNSNSSGTVFSNWYGGSVQYLLRYNATVGLGIQWYLNSNAVSTIIATGYVPNVGDWVHVVGVKDPITNGGQSRVYINGFEAGSKDHVSLSTNLTSYTTDDQIGVFSNNGSPMNGSISNVAYWTDTALTQAQVTEIYNQGVPSNLNNFSGTAPAHWLQIGTNSFFDTNWTCLDEIGNINAVSAGGMTNDDVTNGPGYSANGLGTSSIDIKGDAPTDVPS